MLYGVGLAERPNLEATTHAVAVCSRFLRLKSVLVGLTKLFNWCSSEILTLSNLIHCLLHSALKNSGEDPQVHNKKILVIYDGFISTIPTSV